MRPRRPRRPVSIPGLGGAAVAESSRAFRVLETSHPPVYYLPPADIAPGALLDSAAPCSFCEFKGMARYHDVVGADGVTVPGAAWSYPEPSPGFEGLRDAVAFYPSLMGECSVDGELVEPQPGDFYGGWITSEVVGPFKGGPGTYGW